MPAPPPVPRAAGGLHQPPAPITAGGGLSFFALGSLLRHSHHPGGIVPAATNIIESASMAAYFILTIEVTDLRRFAKYLKEVRPVLEKYKGKYIVRGGKFEVLEGEKDPAIVAVLEFPSMEAAREFYYSEDYKPLLDLRAASTHSEVVLVDGL